MIHKIRWQECCGCGACAQKCAAGALRMEYAHDGGLYPEIREEACTGCGVCLEVCPVLQPPKKAGPISAYACITRSRENWLNSASGGVFCELAGSILEAGGAVYGAVYEEDFTVFHMRIDSAGELIRAQKSKYARSETRSVYSQVREDLAGGLAVLFSGTPCEIAGLKGFLGRQAEDPLLYTVDVICHGAPGGQILKKYIADMEKRLGKRVVSLDFRPKDGGILCAAKAETNSCLEIRTEDGGRIFEDSSQNVYYRGFLAGMTQRHSCYQCRFKNYSSGSDIQLGDYWGIDREHRAFFERFAENKKYGISAVIVKTEKGSRLFQKCSNQFYILKTTLTQVERANLMLNFSSNFSYDYERFFQAYGGLKADSSIISLIKEHMGICENHGASQIRMGFLGSYNIRAAFKALASGADLAFHISSSFISLGSREVPIPWDMEMPLNPFRAEMVKLDFNKDFYRNMEFYGKSADLLVVDLLEERFGVLEFVKTGGFVTKSSAFEDTGYEKKAKGFQQIQNSFELWKEKAEAVIKKIRTCFQDKRIILVRLYLALEDGRGREFAHREQLEEVNARLRSCYDLFEQMAPEAKAVDLPGNICFSDIRHEYGCAPWHLNHEAYCYIARSLLDAFEN